MIQTQSNFKPTVVAYFPNPTLYATVVNLTANRAEDRGKSADRENSQTNFDRPLNQLTLTLGCGQNVCG